MSSMGIVYKPASRAGSNNGSSSSSSSSNDEDENEQLVLLQRTLQDNDRNIIASGKSNVSVISQTLPAYDPSRLKKHGKNGQPPPVAVAKRNARERNRVKQVNNGFATLRQHIPPHVAQSYGDRGKKLSKVETLRMAVEYIRGLQRLLAEADGCTSADLATMLRQHESPVMIASPTGSAYSSSTHNGSSELLGLDEQQQRQQQVDIDLMDEDEELENDEPKESERRAKRFRAHSRLSEKRCRRREDDYRYKQTSFGDEENIEPLINRNQHQHQHHHNNNNSSHNHNHNGFSQSILLQSGSSSIKREVQLQLDADEEESRRSSEGSGGLLLASSSPYTGEIFIENPETGRLMPLKIEEHEAAQLVYVSTGPASAAAYYKSELPDGAAELSWWEQECIVQQIQQPSTPSQRPLGHV